MQIRVRKTTISLIRTTYDPSTKRGRSEQLGTLPKDANAAPEDLLAKLTDAECWQLKNWLPCLQTVRSVENQPSTGLNLPALAAVSRDEWSAVLAAISAAGVGRTRTPQAEKK